MTFHLPILFVCLLNYLYACQRTFRIYKNDRFWIFSGFGTSPSLLHFCGTLRLSTWACTIPLHQYIPYSTSLFWTIFCCTPFWFWSPKTGFGDPVTSPFILTKFAVVPAFCIPCALPCQNIYYFSITVLDQDKTFTIPCRYVINIYHFSITVLSQDKTFTTPCPALI